MSRVQLAGYKKPGTLWRWIVHIGIVLVVSARQKRWCKYSHTELVVDGICHSASTRDDGVRAKNIDLSDGRWDVIDIPHADPEFALQEFERIKGMGYDWLGALWWAIPHARQRELRATCFEVCGIMLGMENPDRQSPTDLIDWAQRFDVNTCYSK
jgi:hypothetical protein